MPPYLEFVLLFSIFIMIVVGFVHELLTMNRINEEHERRLMDLLKDREEKKEPANKVKRKYRDN